MKIANSDVYSGANYSYQKELATAGAGTSGFFAGIVEKHVEKEKSDYKASGKVQTEDGRDIKVEVNVSMARKKERDTFIAMSSPLDNLFDPLIINTKAHVVFPEDIWNSPLVINKRIFDIKTTHFN